ncbi:MAG: MerC domain-containing protein [Ferruginibacter sp.]|nr:MerC domain-containing protein [Ferruginibacter sp.]
MKHIYKYFRKSNLIYLADYSGLFASCLCFIHCWVLPFLIIFLPGLLLHDVWVHPVLCSVAILSTVPMVVNKSFRQQTGLFQFAIVFGNIIMLIILFSHDHLSFRVELLLNTIGGLSLGLVHYKTLKMKNGSNSH